MDRTKRNKKLRLLLKCMNKERKKQSKKIDILCNDLIASHRKFIQKLSVIGFKADFYGSIIGISDLNNLLYTAEKAIKNKIPEANTAFFLRKEEKFELHMPESEETDTNERHRLESLFTAELVDHICKANKICTEEDMFIIGIQKDPNQLKDISAITIPLRQFGMSIGFIFIYRPKQKKITPDEISHISAIGPGLSQAIQSCQMSCNITGK